jgi:hypothetical protein
MMRLTVFVLFSGLVACIAPQAVSAETPLSKRPPLDLSEKISTSGTGEETAFARSVAARYGAGLTREAVIADAQAQGFDCAGGETLCSRTQMDGACADAWYIDLEDGAPIGGRHVKRCMGAMADEE